MYTVDNVPVLDITAKYGGLENITPENDNLLLEIAANFPLQLQREKGDPIMRPGLVVDWSDHSFYTSELKDSFDEYLRFFGIDKPILSNTVG